MFFNYYSLDIILLLYYIVGNAKKSSKTANDFFLLLAVIWVGGPTKRSFAEGRQMSGAGQCSKYEGDFPPITHRRPWHYNTSTR